MLFVHTAQLTHLEYVPNTWPFQLPPGEEKAAMLANPSESSLKSNRNMSTMSTVGTGKQASNTQKHTNHHQLCGTIILVIFITAITLTIL